MQEGYNLLEAGDYPAAQAFFKNYIGVYDKTARICFGRALGLGGSPIQALEFFLQLDEDYPQDIEIELNLGEAYLWNKNAIAAQQIYADILSRQPDNFVANLGYANSYAAMQNNELALEYLDKALALRPGNSSALTSRKYVIIAKAYDHFKRGEINIAKKSLAKLLRADPHNAQALGLMDELNIASKCTVSSTYIASRDLGGNAGRTSQFELSCNIVDKHKLRIDAELRKTKTAVEKASQQSFVISDYYHINKKLKLNLGAGLASGRSDRVTTERVLLKSGLEMFLSDKLYSKLEYTNEVQSYTVDLIERDILMRHLSLSSNIMLTPKWGFYMSGVYSPQSDDNTRILGYTSLYYSIAKVPLVRVGANVNYLSYRQRFENYFSPEQFVLAELFMLIDNYDSPSSFKYHLQASFGKQRIDKESSQAVSKVEARLGYYFKNDLFLNAKYATNSASNATALGEHLFQEVSVTAGLKF